MTPDHPLGAFSISLNVKDLAASRAFYEALGFEAMPMHGVDNWMMMRNGDTVIGLFEGIIPANTLTFNPGWNQSAQPVGGSWDDVRTIQTRLKAEGMELTTECDPDSEGPAHIALMDPDGNAILIDQHR